MKRYVKNNEVFTLEEIRNANKNISIPDGCDLSDMGYKPLKETEKPVKEGFEAIEIIPVNNTQQWELVEIPLEKQIAAKVDEINSATKRSIISLIGNDVHQRNMTAKAVQLTRKEIKGIITPEESIQLDTLNNLFSQVETLINEGNDKELQIKNCTDIQTFKDKCNELKI